jgi:hypothetical protein
MNGIEKSARKTVHTVTSAVITAAAAVQTARQAVRIARKAGSEGRVVLKRVADRVTGRYARRQRKTLAIAAGAAAATVATGLIVAYARNRTRR